MSINLIVWMMSLDGYVYPQWVKIAAMIACMVLFGGMALSLITLCIDAIFDSFWDWSDRLMKIGVGAIVVGMVLLFLLMPIIMFTGTKA